MPSKNFSRESLSELSCGGLISGLTEISNELIDSSRWSLNYELIFKEESTGKFYRSFYDRGATEYQDEGPYSSEGDEVSCDEVEPVEVTVTAYHNVKD